MAAQARKRTAFTLVEMLVVITIIGTLMALLLPAIQAAREAARSLNCRANLENLHAATDQFEAAQGQYPGYQNVIGTGHRKGSWVVALLPYLDGGAIYDTWSDSTQAPRAVYVEVLNCPSDSSQAERDFPSLSYVANAGWGGTVALDGTHLAADSIHDGVFVDRFDDPNLPYDDRKPNLNKDTVTKGDGANYTLLFSENLHEARQPGARGGTPLARANTWVAIEGVDGAAWYDDPTNPTGTLQVVAAKRFTVFVWHNTPDPVRVINGDKYNAVVDNGEVYGHNAARPASFHPGGVNVVFAGGNSQFLSETIDYRVLQQLCTTNDKKSNIPGAGSLRPLSDADFQ